MDDLVAMNDVLMAMADSVMEKQPKPFNPTLKFHDKKIDFKIGGKPPREIFYRKTVTFMTRLPPPVQRKICNCQYICSGDVATIKCHSCAIYDPSGSSFYCNACFDSRHPWYRVKHINTPIASDESIDHTLKIAHRMAEASRYEKEGTDLLTGLREQIPTLQYIADDEKVDNKLRIYGRRVVALEEHVARLREYIQEDIEESKSRKSLVHSLDTPQIENGPASSSSAENALVLATSIEESPETTSLTSPKVRFSAKDHKYQVKKSPGKATAEPAPTEQPTTSTDLVIASASSSSSNIDGNNGANGGNSGNGMTLVPATSTAVAFPLDPLALNGLVKLQATYRRWIGKRIVSSIVSSRTIRVWSAEIGRDFYYDRVTGASSWTASKFLQAEHFDSLEYIHDPNAYATRYIWYCKKMAPRRERKKPMKRKTAAKKIQGFARCILARHRIIQQANLFYRRIYDKESASYYYANIHTGDSMWDKPRIYLSLEPIVYVPTAEEAAAFSARDSARSGSGRYSSRSNASSHRSPRVNRIHTDRIQE